MTLLSWQRLSWMALSSRRPSRPPIRVLLAGNIQRQQQHAHHGRGDYQLADSRFSGLAYVGKRLCKGNALGFKTLLASSFTVYPTCR